MLKKKIFNIFTHRNRYIAKSEAYYEMRIFHLSNELDKINYKIEYNLLKNKRTDEEKKTLSTKYANKLNRLINKIKYYNEKLKM